MKTIFLITLSSLISFFSIIDAAQAKTKKETETIATVIIKRVSEPTETMLSIAYTHGPHGYRIMEDLSLNDPMQLFVKSPFFKSEAGKNKPMYNLHACKEIPSAIYRFLTRSMNAAQEKAIGTHDHAVSTWEYTRGAVTLKSSIPLPKTKQSSDSEGDQMVDDANYDSQNSGGYEA